MKKKKNKILKYILILLICLPLMIWLIRTFSERQLDDLSPSIPCDPSLIEKSDILFVIPKFQGANISENKEWCEEILSYNKKLGLHGVYHTYEEFLEDREFEYIDEGINAFENCFGFYPEMFKAPQMEISPPNKVVVKSRMKIAGKINQIFHKTYHCGDTGFFSNKVVDII